MIVYLDIHVPDISKLVTGLKQPDFGCGTEEKGA